MPAPTPVRLLTAALLGPLALGLVQLVGTAPARAITGGGSDPYHHYTVAILRPGHTQPSCSGVWTDVGGGRRVVITDAHCVSATRGASLRVYFGAHWTSGATTYPGHSYRHPSYDSGTHRNDVAIVTLTSPPAVSPAALARPGEVGRHASMTTVGYGEPYRGERRRAKELITSWNSWRLYLEPGDGNSCTGDSGGPDLVPGTHVLVALTDEGTCSEDADTRLDTTSMQSFLTSAP